MGTQEMMVDEKAESCNPTAAMATTLTSSGETSQNSGPMALL